MATTDWTGAGGSSLVKAASPAALSFLPAGESDLRLKADGSMLSFAARKLLLTVCIENLCDRLSVHFTTWDAIDQTSASGDHELHPASEVSLVVHSLLCGV